MRPNYKALAAKYRERCHLEETRILGMCQVERRLRESLREQEKEIEKLKAKYTEAMDKLIEMQERIWMQGEAANA